MNRFPFVQFEYTHSLGPPAGRYIVHPEEETPESSGVLDELDQAFDEMSAAGAPAGGATVAEAAAPPAAPATDFDDDYLLGSADVLVIRVVGAPPPKGGRFGRGGAPEVADGEKPRETSLTIATIVFGTRLLPDDKIARRFFESVQTKADERDQWSRAALETLNRAVVAYRACAADPYVADVSPLDARATRIGYGIAELVSAGKWEKAIAVPPPPTVRLSRDQKLMPTQAMGMVLTGNGKVLESEELVLRAVLDLEQHRPRAAASGLHAGFELLLGEFGGQVMAGALQSQLERLVEQRDEIKDLAAASRRGSLSTREVERLVDLAEATGALVDRWRYEALGFA
ncbi:hypothetical protein [Paraconexibacter algicola]|uniref:Uncharacterized protein n=1 Tax=Paraconexibacter algicola TaxID=2133960 RepID=A0A2T4UJZ4_9ACTN|nr:hypothetical protein [Paraconexibacter algicola]PTL59560.1 hypothetical protein C7Y72_07815 [Paraconexibacter algicola]